MAKTQTVLVTGATSGIGREVALHLARLGHRVLATGRKTDLLAELEAEADELKLETFTLDVTDAASIDAARDEVERRTEGYGLDVLVNNAGFGTMAPMERITDEDMRRQFETNVFGLVAVTQAFLPAMRARGAGKVINISSVMGRITLPLQGIYNATKHAVEALTDALRQEVRSFGIRVALVEPGTIRSNFEATAARQADKYREMDPAYVDPIDAYAKVVASSYRKSPGPRCIARTVARIVRIKRPRPRYVSPAFNLLAVWLIHAMPTRLVDWILRRVMHLIPAKMLPRPK